MRPRLAARWPTLQGSLPITGDGFHPVGTATRRAPGVQGGYWAPDGDDVLNLLVLLKDVTLRTTHTIHAHIAFASTDLSSLTSQHKHKGECRSGREVTTRGQNQTW